MAGVASLPASPVDGQLKIQWVPVIVDPTAPKLTEINATGSVDMSCYFTTWTETGTQATVPDDRICSRQVFEQPGKETRTLSVMYIENPTAPTLNLAATTLAKNTTGFFVERRGVPFENAFAIGDLVDVWPVKTGLQVPTWAAGQTGKMAQKLFVTGAVIARVACVA